MLKSFFHPDVPICLLHCVSFNIPNTSSFHTTKTYMPGTQATDTVNLHEPMPRICHSCNMGVHPLQSTIKLLSLTLFELRWLDRGKCLHFLEDSLLLNILEE